MICNTAFALALFSPDSSKALEEQFKKFNQQENEDKSLKYDDGASQNDIEETKVIQQIGEAKSPKDLQSFEKEKRNEVIKKLKMNGLLIRQIQRLTGISFSIIRKL